MQPFPEPEYNGIAEQVLELSPHLLPNASAPTIFFPDPSFHDLLLFHSDVGLPEAASLPAARPTPESAQPTGRSRHKRSTRKGRHSKICTAKGPRDRRMRLSIGVAQKFFKLQDMLGFDKASKTVQWLLTMSKAAIKELADISSSSKTICSFLGDQLRSPKSDSSTLTGSKDISKSAPGESMKKAKNDCSVRSTKKALAAAQLHSAKAREMRAKARERARERTREKQKMMTSLCSVDEGKLKAELNLKDLKALLELANYKEEAIGSSSYQCLNPINNSTCNDMFQQDSYWEMDGFSSSYVSSSMAAFSISYPNL